MKELTDEQIIRIKARQEADRPFIPCSLMNHWDWSCDNCRETVNVQMDNRRYFCVKEIGEYALAPAMKKLRKNIQLSWGPYYKREKADESPTAGTDNGGENGTECGVGVPTQEAEAVLTNVMDSETIDRGVINTESAAETCGSVYSG